MSRKPSVCGANLEPIHMAGRRLSCETIMFHQSIADRLGLNVTDHKCVDFLLLHGPSTAGELSKRSGLTTGAMTAALDRLEKAGFVRRAADPADRRRVIVHPVFERLEQIGMLFSDLSSRINQLAIHYSESELAVIIDFMNRSCDILHEAAIHLRNDQSSQRVQKSGTKSRQPTKKATTSASLKRTSATRRVE